MPKERRTRSVNYGAQSCESPYPCSGSSSHHKGSPSSSPGSPRGSPEVTTKEMTEWDEVRCSVCMEYPHNAVCLICSSGAMGCQPFMCDTSYRHSNCLDQYRKAFSGSSSSSGINVNREQPEFSCPLCRGEVTGWKVVEDARRYMNSKVRSCSTETCGFAGSYRELVKHAREEHPTVRPSEADHKRERDWRRMEQRRDLEDLFSTMQPAMSGEDEEELRRFSHSMAVMLILTFNSAAGTSWTSARSSRAPSRVPSWSRASRVPTGSRRRRRELLWGGHNREPRADDRDATADVNDTYHEDNDDFVGRSGGVR